MNEEVKPYRAYTTIDFFKDDRYVRHILHPSVDEVGYWDAIRAQSPAIAPFMEEARIWILLLNRQRRVSPVTPAAEVWSRIAPRIENDGNARIRSIKRKVTWVVSAAAAVLLWLVIMDWREHGVHQYRTEYGAINKIDLPDGSLVTLNGHSSVRYERGWSSSRPRELWLEGEAFFHVKHVAVKNRWQQSDSFRVHVQDLNVTVTGTQFNIRSRRGLVEISLLEGRLRIDRQDGFRKNLLPGEVFVIDSVREVTVNKPVDILAKNAWTREEIDLDGYTLADIIRVLEDSYGYQITLSSPELANKKLTGTIPASSGEDIIFVIEKVFNLNVERNGKQLVIKKI